MFIVRVITASWRFAKLICNKCWNNLTQGHLVAVGNRTYNLQPRRQGQPAAYQLGHQAYQINVLPLSYSYTMTLKRQTASENYSWRCGRLRSALILTIKCSSSLFPSLSYKKYLSWFVRVIKDKAWSASCGGEVHHTFPPLYLL